MPRCWARLRLARNLLWLSTPFPKNGHSRWKSRATAAVAPGEEHGLAPTDAVIETVGKALVLATAYRFAKRGGRIVTVGLPNPAEDLSINALSLVADGKALMGSYMGSSIPARDIPRYIALWRAGRLPVRPALSGWADCPRNRAKRPGRDARLGSAARETGTGAAASALPRSRSMCRCCPHCGGCPSSAMTRLP